MIARNSDKVKDLSVLGKEFKSFMTTFAKRNKEVTFWQIQLRPAVLNLGYVRNLNVYAKSLRFLMEMPLNILLRGTRVIFILFRCTRPEKGWEPLVRTILTCTIIDH